MDNKQVFELGLGLSSPWRIGKLELEKEEGTKGVLHIHLDYPKGSKFLYEGKSYSVYDHQPRTWQHLNFFEHKCYLYARVPRTETKNGSVRLIQVPWAEEGSSFTLKFEEDAMTLVNSGMSATAVGKRYEIDSRVVFRIIKKYVVEALVEQELQPVKELSVDETSSKKGHNYLTVMADRDRKKVVGISLGKDKEAFRNCLKSMELRGAMRDKVKSITMDMSTSYISGAKDYVPKASIVFDRFHISKLLNEAIDKIRRSDQKEFDELKRSRYLWLKNYENLKKEDQQRVDELSNSYVNIGTAYQLKEQFRALMNEAINSSKLKPLKDWIKLARDSELEPIIGFCNMLQSHWYGVKTYFQKIRTNAYAERVNLKIQEIKRLAKGYRNLDNFMIMIYFHLGGLDLIPTKNS